MILKLRLRGKSYRWRGVISEAFKTRYIKMHVVLLNIAIIFVL